MRYSTNITLFFLLAFSCLIFASDKGTSGLEKFALHLKGGFDYSVHLPNFTEFQNSVNCGLFEKGSGSGFSGWVFLEKQMNQSSYINIGMGIVDRSGTLVLDDIYPVRNITTGVVEDVNAENKIEADLLMLELMPELRLNIIDHFVSGPLRFVAAPRIYFPIQSPTFTQYEEIVSPEGAVFINNDGTRVQSRDIASGSMPTINSFGYGASVGLENMLKMGTSSHFTQQIVFDYNFSDFTEDAEWKAIGIRLELGIRFGFFENEPVELPVEKPEPDIEKPIGKPDIIVENEVKTDPVTKPEISFSLSKIENAWLETGKELLATQPLVNAVFFEKDKSDIPSEYFKSIGVEKPDVFFGNAVDLHYYNLVRIAEIINNNPKATINLYPSIAGDESNPSLAAERANNVKIALKYLGIPESKISVSKTYEPRFKSNEEYVAGINENRRVEIDVKNAPLQEYVDIQTFLTVSGELPLKVTLESIPEGQQNTLSTDLSDTIIHPQKSGDFRIFFEKRLALGTNSLPYEVTLRSGTDEVEMKKNLDMRELESRLIELKLEDFVAILRFEYNSAILSEENKVLLSQLVEFLPGNSNINIYGSADALGTEEANIRLEKQRADVTSEYITSRARDKSFVINSYPAIKKYPEDTPQGRFLNRSIRITVEKLP